MIIEHFQGLTEPRIERCKRHYLLDIVALTNRPEPAIINPTRNFSQESKRNDYHPIPRRPPSLYPSPQR